MQDSSLPLDIFNEFTYVIFYEDKDESIHNLIKHVDDDHTLVDLSVSEKLKHLCLEHYKPQKLPFMSYRGGTVYPTDNIVERLDDIDNENLEKYRTFISEYVISSGITVFMKGTVEKPKCKFSKRLVKLFEEQNLRNIKDYDILSDQCLRYYMKSITNWPTFPQIFINGKFLGGLDRFSELVENGKLDKY